MPGQLDTRRISDRIKIGQALREALSLGMHTEMRSIYLDDVYVQRSHTVWWTVYVLERQITSLLGLPMGITEEKISTPFPVLQGQTQKSIALQIQVQLARVLAKIDESVFIHSLVRCGMLLNTAR